LIDTINFSFWTEDETKFRVTYKGTTYTGYFAACACVNRAIESGINLTDAKCMKNITTKDVEEIFTGDDGQIMPLCDLRAKAIAEAGRILLEQFDGSFYTCLKMCDRSAMKLLAIVVENFDSYRDYATFKGKKISFLKRAQILVADLHGCLHDKNDLGNFSDIADLTMFADYRVPQILAFFSVLKYSPKLEETLRSKVLLQPGSETEVEIRAFSICDLVKRYEELRTKSDRKVPRLTAVLADNLLWYRRREIAQDIQKKVEYHRVRTIYY
uniref:Queuosine 5'-phosphate N-glycosylase/hydrolase n=1 Tax=Enterobius vermicularis TaxID=51028 RepID=A0A0N4V1L4_ENTVE